MALEGFEVVLYTISFLVPGFVWHSTLTTLITVRELRKELTFLRFLTLSCFNYAIWSWLVFLIFYSPFFTQHPVRTALAWGWIILAGPVLLGLALGFLKTKEISRRLLLSFGFRPPHDIPTSWDYKFQKTDSPVWIAVALKSGERILGLYGYKSFSSTDPNERDLYIESIYKIDEKDNWIEKPRSDGMIISKDHIKWIEFWKLEQE